MRAAPIAALALVSSVAWGAPDYAPASSEWNGLSKLLEESRSAGCEMEPSATLDWSALEANDVLWFVYPRAAIEPDKLERWLKAGGRVVIADDFGAATQALQVLGIRRGHPSFEAPDTELGRYDHNPNLPVAHLRWQSELGHSTPVLVANHPASFETATPATFEFAPGAALVVEGRVAQGHFVAIADPSVFINNMLEIDGNRAFAHALVEHTCRAGQDKIHLFTQTFTARGEPRANLPAAPKTDSAFGQFNKKMADVNSSLKTALGDPRSLYALASATALVALLLLAGAFPSRNEIRDRWTRVGRLLAPGIDERHPLAGLPWDYALPAGIVREEALGRLENALGEKIDFDYLGPQALLQKVSALFGPLAGQRAAELWRILHKIRWRTVDGEIMPDERVGRRTLIRMHQLATALFESLDENPNASREV